VNSPPSVHSAAVAFKSRALAAFANDSIAFRIAASSGLAAGFYSKDVLMDCGNAATLGMPPVAANQPSNPLTDRSVVMRKKRKRMTELLRSVSITLWSGTPYPSRTSY
jgi:hypothetical protein